MWLDKSIKNQLLILCVVFDDAPPHFVFGSGVGVLSFLYGGER